MLIKNEPGPSL